MAVKPLHKTLLARPCHIHSVIHWVRGADPFHNKRKSPALWHYQHMFQKSPWRGPENPHGSQSNYLSFYLTLILGDFLNFQVLWWDCDESFISDELALPLSRSNKKYGIGLIIACLPDWRATFIVTYNNSGIQYSGFCGFIQSTTCIKSSFFNRPLSVTFSVSIFFFLVSLEEGANVQLGQPGSWEDPHCILMTVYLS